MKRALKSCKVCGILHPPHELIGNLTHPSVLVKRPRDGGGEETSKTLTSVERRKANYVKRLEEILSGNGKKGTRRLRGIVGYDGTRFHGFQRQVTGTWTAPTVQTALEEALAKSLEIMEGKYTLIGAFGEAQNNDFQTIGPHFGIRPPIAVVGSSRTDSQVHATGQLFHADIPETVCDVSELRRKMNEVVSQLYYGSSVFVHDLEFVPIGEYFDCSRSACGKRYCYTIYDGDSDESMAQYQCAELYSCGFRKNKKEELIRLDTEEMQKASQGFLGKKNFRLFTRSFNRSGRSNYERTMVAARVLRTKTYIVPDFETEHENDGGFVHFLIEGDGFLLYMVRSMMSALLEVGKGNMTAEELLVKAFNIPEEETIIREHLVFKPAYPRGLCLTHIYYPDDPGLFGNKLCCPSDWPETEATEENEEDAKIENNMMMQSTSASH